MTGTGLPCGVPQYGEAAGIFYVQALMVSDSGGPGGKRTATPLRLVRDAHTRGGGHQEPPDGTMQPEYPDKVAEKVCGDSSKVHGGDLQYNR